MYRVNSGTCLLNSAYNRKRYRCTRTGILSPVSEYWVLVPALICLPYVFDGSHIKSELRTNHLLLLSLLQVKIQGYITAII